MHLMLLYIIKKQICFQTFVLMCVHTSQVVRQEDTQHSLIITFLLSPPPPTPPASQMLCMRVRDSVRIAFRHLPL